MFVLRATPSKAELKEMATGRDQKGLGKYGASRSWWEKGALVVDEHGPAVVDADGCRVPIPVPPEDGSVVQSGTQVSGGGMPGRTFVIKTYDICDRDDRIVATLPDDGFTENDFERFAAAAGLDYRVRIAKGRPPRLPGYVSLTPCVNDAAFRKAHPRHWLGREIWKLLGAKEEWYPYYGGRTYPPMDPAYLAA